MDIGTLTYSSCQWNPTGDWCRLVDMPVRVVEPGKCSDDIGKV